MFIFISSYKLQYISNQRFTAATIPEGTDDVVMLVGSANSNRWKNKGAEKSVRDTVESFKATLAPTSGMKVRAKERDTSKL